MAKLFIGEESKVPELLSQVLSFQDSMEIYFDSYDKSDCYETVITCSSDADEKAAAKFLMSPYTFLACVSDDKTTFHNVLVTGVYGNKISLSISRPLEATIWENNLLR